MRAGHAVKSHQKRGVGRKEMNLIKRANTSGGVMTISSPEGMRRQMKMSNLRSMFMGTIRAKGKQNARTRYMKGLYSDTLQF